MPQTLTIGDRKIGENYPPLVIAEIGINHDGSFETNVCDQLTGNFSISLQKMLLKNIYI